MPKSYIFVILLILIHDLNHDPLTERSYTENMEIILMIHRRDQLWGHFIPFTSIVFKLCFCEDFSTNTAIEYLIFNDIQA